MHLVILFLYNSTVSAQETIAPPAGPLQHTPELQPDIADSPNAAVASAHGDAGVDTEETPRRTSPWLALRHRDFRLYFSGNFVSQAGTQMQIVAINVQLWDLTHDPVLLGLRGLFKLLPVLALSMFGGVIADALDRRRLLIATQTTMALVSLTLATSTMFGWVSPALIYLLTVIAACAVAFDNPARSAMIPNLVPRKHLPNALSLNIIVWQVAMIFGPMVAGMLLPIGATGLSVIYWVDSISFGAVIIALLLMRVRFQTTETRDVSFKAALDGLRFLRNAPIIMSTMTLDFFATFFGAAMMLIPAFAQEVLHAPRESWGVLYAAPAIGAVGAGFVMSWLGNVRHQGWIVLFSIAAYGLATVIFGMSSIFWLAVLGLAGTGAADTVSMVMRQTIRQLSTPDNLRGRMTSVNMIFYMGGPQLGELEAGIAAAILGYGTSIVLGGFAVIAVTVVTGFLVPSLRNYDRGG
ncbi:MAG TPA: MFS transporter [Chloroflexia bacterium]|nr:MFS transporter [Chloroflexia bacterium]